MRFISHMNEVRRLYLSLNSVVSGFKVPGAELGPACLLSCLLFLSILLCVDPILTGTTYIDSYGVFLDLYVLNKGGS